MRTVVVAVCLSIVVAVAMSPGTASAAGIEFGPPEGYPGVVLSGGAGPSELVVADFNGDGLPDLASGNTIATGISLSRNAGNGTFVEAGGVATGADTPLVAAGDFNEDGHQDLVAASFLTSSLSVYAGHGDFTFTPVGSYPIPSIPFQLAVADVNGDGHQDIILVNGAPALVTVLLGNGDGTFRPGPTAMPGGLFGLTMAVGDLDGDGIPDLAVADIDFRLRVLLGRGDGSFTEVGSYGVGGLPEYIEIGDLDRDGNPDLVVANAATNDLSLLYGTGGGGFEPEVRMRDPQGALLDAKPGVTLADYDGDGWLDIASVSDFASQVTIMRGVGGRRFEEAGRYQVSDAPEAILSADVDGDGAPDILAPGNVPLHGLDVKTRIWLLRNKRVG
ncbi:FG-GAP repeat domain-containing protein [Nocardia concava]|uniref:FG-GAP repeat domain-containing protein n=1 Tax=Nocardia concava TaxID=257281 RepID=UPI000684BEE5|nr:VCBS repeat-containing protein [Nocardia concava]